MKLQLQSLVSTRRFTRWQPIMMAAPVILLLGAMLACQSPLLAQPTATSTDTATPTATSTPTSTPTPTPTPTPTDTPTPTLTNTLVPPTATSTASPTPELPKYSFMLVEIKPHQGKFTTQLKEHAQKAQELGLTPVVEFAALWCPACEAIKTSLDDKNELMLDAFQGTYIIRVDIDNWLRNSITQAGFEFEFIPIFFLVDAEGKPTRITIGGDAWGENTPEQMAPVLKKFFRAYQKK